MSESNPNGQQPLDYWNPRHFPKERWRRSTWVLAMLAVAIWATAIGIFRGKMSGTTTGRYGVKSAANLHSIGQAILMYTADHQGDYPDSFRTILANEDVTPGIFVSPFSNDSPADGPTTQAVLNQFVTPGHCSYVYLGRGLTTKTVTDDTIIAYELLADYQGRATEVLVGDGHVEYVLGAQSTTIAKRATTGPFPVTMPATVPSN